MAKFYYSAFPTVLFDILDRDDILMFLVVAGFGKHGCNYSYDSWKERFEIGSDGVNRSRKKLEFLNLIRVERRTEIIQGKPYKIYRSFAVMNPYAWKLTADLNSEIVKQSKKLNEPVGIFEKTPFKNIEDFESQFNAKYPHLRVRRKGRSDGGAEIESLTAESEIHDEVETSKLKDKEANPHFEKLQKIRNPECSFLFIIRQYAYCIDAILLMRSTSDHGFTQDGIEYLTVLHNVFLERSKSGNPGDMLLIKHFEKLREEQVAPEKIEVELISFYKNEIKGSV